MTHRPSGFYLQVTRAMSSDLRLFFGFKGGQHSSIDLKQGKAFAKYLRECAAYCERAARL